MKLLFDLLPIALFFVAFKVWNIYVATSVAITAVLVQVVWSALRHRRVDPMLWVSLVIVAVFGGATLVLHNDTFIKWKPTVLYGVFSIAMLVSQFALGKNLIQKALGQKISLPQPVWNQLNVAWALFFAVLGGGNLVIAYHFSTDIWVNFKLFGTTGAMIAFIVAQSLWLSKHMKVE